MQNLTATSTNFVQQRLLNALDNVDGQSASSSAADAVGLAASTVTSTLENTNGAPQITPILQSSSSSGLDQCSLDDIQQLLSGVFDQPNPLQSSYYLDQLAAAAAASSSTAAGLAATNTSPSSLSATSSSAVNYLSSSATISSSTACSSATSNTEATSAATPYSNGYRITTTTTSSSSRSYDNADKSNGNISTTTATTLNGNNNNKGDSFAEFQQQLMETLFTQSQSNNGSAAAVPVANNNNGSSCTLPGSSMLNNVLANATLVDMAELILQQQHQQRNGQLSRKPSQQRQSSGNDTSDANDGNGGTTSAAALAALNQALGDMNAEELSTVMNNLFGAVASANIGTAATTSQPSRAWSDTTVNTNTTTGSYGISPPPSLATQQQQQTLTQPQLSSKTKLAYGQTAAGGRHSSATTSSATSSPTPQQQQALLELQLLNLFSGGGGVSSVMSNPSDALSSSNSAVADLLSALSATANGSGFTSVASTLSPQQLLASATAAMSALSGSANNTELNSSGVVSLISGYNNNHNSGNNNNNNTLDANTIAQFLSSAGSNGRLFPSSPSKSLDSYCEICDKNLCNRYFLKTHKMKKHGISEDGTSGSPVKSFSSSAFSTSNGFDNNNENGRRSTTNSNAGLELKSPSLKRDASAAALFDDLEPSATKLVKFCADLLPTSSQYNATNLAQQQPATSMMTSTHNKTGSGGGTPMSNGDCANARKNATDSRLLSSVSKLDFFAVLEQMQKQGIKFDMDEITNAISGTSTASGGFACDVCQREFDTQIDCFQHKITQHADTLLINAAASAASPVSPPQLQQQQPTQPAVKDSPTDFLGSLPNFLLTSHLPSVNNAELDPQAVAVALSNLPGLDRLLAAAGGSGLSALLGGLSGALGGSGGMVNRISSPQHDNFQSTALTGLTSSSGKSTAPKRQYTSTSKNYCDLCSKEVCNKYFLRTHMLKMHNIVIDENKPIIGNIDTTEKEKIGAISFRCDVCFLGMKTRQELRQHKSDVHRVTSSSSHHYQPATPVGGGGTAPTTPSRTPKSSSAGLLVSTDTSAHKASTASLPASVQVAMLSLAAAAANSDSKKHQQHFFNPTTNDGGAMTSSGSSCNASDDGKDFVKPMALEEDGGETIISAMSAESGITNFLRNHDKSDKSPNGYASPPPPNETDIDANSGSVDLAAKHEDYMPKDSNITSSCASSTAAFDILSVTSSSSSTTANPPPAVTVHQHSPLRRCQYCGEMFPSPSKLQRHAIETHTEAILNKAIASAAAASDNMENSVAELKERRQQLLSGALCAIDCADASADDAEESEDVLTRVTEVAKRMVAAAASQQQENSGESTKCQSSPYTNTVTSVSPLNNNYWAAETNIGTEMKQS